MTSDEFDNESWAEYIRSVHRTEQKYNFPESYRTMPLEQKRTLTAQIKLDVWKVYPNATFLWVFNKNNWKIAYGIFLWSPSLNEARSVRRGDKPRLLGQLHSHSDLLGAGYDNVEKMSGEYDCENWAWSSVWATKIFVLGIPAEVLQRGLTDYEINWRLAQLDGRIQ